MGTKFQGIPVHVTVGPDDNFESVDYDMDYRSENHAYSKYIKVHYRGGLVKDVHIDSITRSQPRLWAIKHEVLVIMSLDTTRLIGMAMPAVMFVLTISPTITSVTPLPGTSGYRVLRRTIPKAAAAVNTGDTEIAGIIAKLRKAGKRIVVNVGGTGEVVDAINLNPNKVAPRTDIPNWIAKKGEEIGTVFAPNSVDEIVSNRLPPNTFDWTKVLPGAQKVLKPGGRISIRFQGVGSDAPVILEQLRKLGFGKIENPLNMGATIEAVKM